MLLAIYQHSVRARRSRVATLRVREFSPSLPRAVLQTVHVRRGAHGLIDLRPSVVSGASTNVKLMNRIIATKINRIMKERE